MNVLPYSLLGEDSTVMALSIEMLVAHIKVSSYRAPIFAF